LSIAIIGIGGIGGILAALFYKKGHKITAISSQKSVEDINKNGLSVSSSFYGDFQAYPEATTILDTPVDIIIFTTKYPYLKESLKRIKKDKIGNPLYISLLNGLGSREQIIDNFGSNFLTGSIGSIEVFRDGDGIIKQPRRQSAFINLSREPKVKKDDFQKTIEIIKSIGISVFALSDHNEVIWRKLVRLGAIASTTAAFQKSIGEIRDNKEMRDILVGLITEGSYIANAMGVSIEASRVIDEVNQLPHHLKTSLSRDLKEGKPSELDAITIAIIKKAEENKISTLYYRSILELIKEKYAA